MTAYDNYPFIKQALAVLAAITERTDNADFQFSPTTTVLFDAVGRCWKAFVLRHMQFTLHLLAKAPVGTRKEQFAELIADMPFVVVGAALSSPDISTMFNRHDTFTPSPELSQRLADVLRDGRTCVALLTNEQTAWARSRVPKTTDQTTDLN